MDLISSTNVGECVNVEYIHLINPKLCEFSMNTDGYSLICFVTSLVFIYPHYRQAPLDSSVGRAKDCNGFCYPSVMSSNLIREILFL